VSEIETSLLSIDQLGDAAAIIAAGGVVAFPTETVYGLGADATNASAILRIFGAKGRPSDNPLIVHVADVEALSRVAKDVSPIAQKLIDAFWPGPLTVVMPKGDSVSAELCAGLPTVAVRMPKHPVAIELIRRAGAPLVAPSANRSGRPSGTTWEAVRDDLLGRVDGIVCGEPTEFGLESTVVDVTQTPPCVLRHGAISLMELQSVCPEVVSIEDLGESEHVRIRKSPGTRHRHYQPHARVVVDSSDAGGGSENRSGVEPIASASRAWIGLSTPKSQVEWCIIKVCGGVDEYAKILFAFFREMDRLGIDTIVCGRVPEDGIGRALMDRIIRASVEE